MEGSGDHVLLAGQQVHVGDGVHERHPLAGCGGAAVVDGALLASLRAAFGRLCGVIGHIGRRSLRRLEVLRSGLAVGQRRVQVGHVHGLRLVSHVRVGAESRLLARQLLEGHRVAARELVRGDLELERHDLLGALGDEFRLGAALGAGGVVGDPGVGAVLGHQVHGAGHLVGAAGNEVGEPHLVANRLLAARRRVVVARGRRGRRRGDCRVGHRLAAVGRVLVRRVGDVAQARRLEGHEGLAGEVDAGEVERHVDRAALPAFGRDRRAAGHRVAVGALHLAEVVALGVAVVQRAGDRVLAAGLKVPVAHHVGQGRALGRRVGLMVEVAGHDGADDGHAHRLALVVGVRMRSQDVVAVHDPLVGDEPHAPERRRVDVEGHGHGVRLELGHELALGGRHDAAVVAVLVKRVELALELVRRVGRQVLVADHVHQVDALVGRACLLVVGAVGQRRAEQHLLVVDGAQVEHVPVASDRHAHVHEPVVGVGGAAQLVELVLVVGQRAKRVGGRGLPVRAAAEPDAARRVELRVVDRPVLGHGRVRGVDAPSLAAVEVAGGVDHAVLVGHEDVALAGRLGGQAEGHARHPGLAVLVGLHQPEVASLRLVGDRVRRVRDVDRHAVLAYVGDLAPAFVQPVAVRRLRLPQRVRAVGEGSARGRGGPVLVGHERPHDLAGLVVDAVHAHRVLGVVGDRDLGAGERGRAERQRLAELRVDLAHRDVAAGHLVGDGRGVVRQVDDEALSADLEGLRPALVEQVARRCLGLADGVGAVGQRVSRGGRHAVLAGRDRLHDLARGVPGPVNDHVVRGVVGDLELGASKRRVALRV